MSKVILKTYRVNIEPLTEKRACLHYLFDEVLHKDQNWHFFLDEGGITLRFSPLYARQVKQLLTSSGRNFETPDADYEPGKHEYEHIRFIDEDWIPLFHTLAVLSVKYPPSVTTKYVLERMNHTLTNQAGIHNFYKEAELYSQLALGRAELGGIVGRGRS